LFYSQISSFASVSAGSSSYLIKLFELSQLQSVTVVDGAACYAPDMSSYDVTVAKLVGPLFVLFFSVTWTWVLRALQPQLLLRNIRISVSYSGTLMASILFSFSVVSQVVFTLVECTQYDETGVVFIDGTVPCYNRVWKGLMVIVVLLCLFPVLFFASLKMNKLSENARAVVCRNFTQPAYYWSAVTLGFRLLISIMQFLQVRHPNLLAFIRMLLSTSMLVLHTHTRPYRLTHAFWIDVVCYLCLSAQFGLQMMFAEHDFLAVIPTNNQEEQFYGAIVSLSSFFRFLPFAVLVVVWLKTSVGFDGVLKAVSRRFGFRMPKRRDLSGIKQVSDVDSINNLIEMEPKTFRFSSFTRSRTTS